SKPNSDDVVRSLPNSPDTFINLRAMRSLNPIPSSQTPNSPYAKSSSFTCFNRLPISNNASSATRLYAFISAVITSMFADNDISLYYFVYLLRQKAYCRQPAGQCSIYS